MNKVIICGNLTKDPEVRYSNPATGQSNCIAKYTLAVSRRDKTADYIPCVAFGKAGEFVEKYLHKGIKILVTGHINTGSYIGQDGNRVYTWNVVAEDHEFVEKRQDAPESHQSAPAAPKYEQTTMGFDVQQSQQSGFMEVSDEGLPWT